MHWRLQTLFDRSRATLHRSFARTVLPIRREKGVVSFTFDDFPCSAGTSGREILERHEVCGTFYVSAGLAGQEGYGGTFFSTPDIKLLHARGHEIGCHTYGHRLVATLSPAGLDDQLRRNLIAVAEQIPDYRLRSFSYPDGSVSLAAKRRLMRHFACCRGVQEGLNVGNTDLGLLRANKIYGRQNNTDSLLELVRESSCVGGWLIFYTHDVRDRPSPFGCTPDELDAIVGAAVSSGANVLPICKAHETFAAP